MARMNCPMCGKQSSDDIDDSGICKKCDKKLSEARKQRKLSEFINDEVADE